MSNDLPEKSTPAALQTEPWPELRRHTAARIALGRTGGSLTTRELLAFNHDHALARDAVNEPFDAIALATELRAVHPSVLVLASAAPDRATYLRRPDLGRQLSGESRQQISAISVDPCALVLLVSDGLSALAAARQAPLLLAALRPQLRNAGFPLGPTCVIRHARVALQDEIGGQLQARWSLMLIGERPGLGTPDSLGAYLTFNPRPGRTDADRNCVSNIRPDGFPVATAAEKIMALLIASRQLQLSGTGLKDASPPWRPPVRNARSEIP